MNKTKKNISVISLFLLIFVVVGTPRVTGTMGSDVRIQRAGECLAKMKIIQSALVKWSLDHKDEAPTLTQGSAFQKTLPENISFDCPGALQAVKYDLNQAGVNSSVNCSFHGNIESASRFAEQEDERKAPERVTMVIGITLVCAAACAMLSAVIRKKKSE